MTWPVELDATLSALRAHLATHAPGDPVGAYLYGSAAAAGLGPHSDVDVLVLTNRSLSARERREWVELLLPLSGWSGHGDQFPEHRFPGITSRRPIELTCIVVDDVVGWPPAPIRDFQYGEWLRAELIAAPMPGPRRDPDVISLLATAHHRHHLLSGAPLDNSTRPPRDRLDAAMVAALPELLAGLRGDETNALLTLARIVTTLRTGDSVAKDVAAEEVAGCLDLPDHQNRLLIRAAAHYRGEVPDDWSDTPTGVSALALLLAEHAYSIHGD